MLIFSLLRLLTRVENCPNIVSTMSDIVRQLEEKKSYRFAPVANVGKIPVEINIIPLRLIHVDDATSRIEVDFLVVVHWYDERLAWHRSTEYDKTCVGQFPRYISLNNLADSIWYPMFIITESTASSRGGLDQYVELVKIYGSTGKVSFDGRFRGEVSCPMARKYYPFDMQICNVTVLGTSVEYKIGDDFINVNGTNQQQILDSYRESVYETKIFSAEMDTNEWRMNPTEELIAKSLTRPVVKSTSEAQSLTHRSKRWLAQRITGGLYSSRNAPNRTSGVGLEMTNISTLQPVAAAPYQTNGSLRRQMSVKWHDRAILHLLPLEQRNDMLSYTNNNSRYYREQEQKLITPKNSLLALQRHASAPHIVRKTAPLRSLTASIETDEGSCGTSNGLMRTL